MHSEKINVDTAEKDSLFSVVANLIPIRKEDGKALILKRSQSEQNYPDKWGTIGGILRHQDFDLSNPSSNDNNGLTFENPFLNFLGRKAHQESGIRIEEPLLFISNKLVIRPDGMPISLITFAARYMEGEIVLQVGRFAQFAWVGGDEIDEYDCIQGVKEEVKKALSIFSYAGYIESKKDE